MYKVFLCATCALPIFAATQPIADEQLRVDTLAQLFPGSMVTTAVDRDLDLSRRLGDAKHYVSYPDAFAKERIYRVTGAPANQIERCAASGRLRAEREIRMQMFAWPRRAGEFVAVIQYAFPGRDPDWSCASIGLIAHVTVVADRPKITDRFLLDAQKHEALQNVMLTDLTGDGVEELIVESDSGDPQSTASIISIFDLRGEKLEQILEHASRMYAKMMGEELYKQELDISRSLKMKGEQFCFTRTVYVEDGKWYGQPKVTRPCYTKGRGVDAAEIGKRQELLK